MSTFLTPTTELEAVNIILQGIGEQPVNTLPAEGISEASQAHNTLLQQNRMVQSEGLHCNTEYNYTLTPNTDDNIVLPGDCLEIDASDPTFDYVWRDGKLYDKDNSTFTIDEDVDVDIVFCLPFTDLPEHVRTYITIKAARIFQKNVIGSGELHGFTQEDEGYARAKVNRHELNHSDISMLQNFQTGEILRRWR